jgi:RimJ/RimL family protein N-acetyltransferase
MPGSFSIQPVSFQSGVVPVLETERLRLRGHSLSDFVHCAAMWADPKVTEHIGGKPLTEEECWTRLLRYIGHWALLGFGYWVVEEKATGNFVGETGFADYKRDLEPGLKGVPEIGWVFVAQAHGKGYATEAVRAVVAWGDVHFSSSSSSSSMTSSSSSLSSSLPFSLSSSLSSGRTGARTACIIVPENIASIRVAVKCGYREVARTTYKGHPTIVFVREPGGSL